MFEGLIVLIVIIGSNDMKVITVNHFLSTSFQTVCISCQEIRFLAMLEKYIAKGMLNQLWLYSPSYIWEGILKNKSKPTKINPKIIPTSAIFKEGEIPANATNKIT